MSLKSTDEIIKALNRWYPYRAIPEQFNTCINELDWCNQILGKRTMWWPLTDSQHYSGKWALLFANNKNYYFFRDYSVYVEFALRFG